jgi:hypothetical protein
MSLLVAALEDVEHSKRTQVAPRTATTSRKSGAWTRRDETRSAAGNPDQATPAIPSPTVATSGRSRFTGGWLSSIRKRPTAANSRCSGYRLRRRRRDRPTTSIGIGPHAQPVVRSTSHRQSLAGVEGIGHRRSRCTERWRLRGRWGPRRIARGVSCGYGVAAR